MDLQYFKAELEKELNGNILDYWVNNVYNKKNKTFYGRVGLDDKPDPGHKISAVLITRILWAFSAAYRLYPKPEYKKMADEAYRVIISYFWDIENGGIFWEVDANNSPCDTKKQFYALAFCIYACAEYYMAFNNEQAKQLAISLFIIIETKSYNPGNKGYIDVLSRDYKKISGLRLSEKEIAGTMTMNTHLHILEAYTNLYRIWKDEELKKQLENLLHIFLEKIIDRQTWHFNLFFNETWEVVGNVDSYGHDIEGTWLLYEAAEILGNETIIEEVKKTIGPMSDIVQKEGVVNETGALVYEKENGGLIEEFHWWPQAEAMVGFFNSWQLTGNKKYFDTVFNNWQFIKKHIIDHKKGEWHWGLDKNLGLLAIEKVNGWKGPYHNGRMCIELIKRINLA